MSEVTLTAAMRANLLSLQGTATLMGETQFRLATGNKVNSALDNPSSFFAAQGLNNRAADLSALLDGMGQAVQTLKAADEGIQGLTSLVEQAKATAESAKSAASGASGESNASIWFTDATDMADLTAGTNTIVTADDSFDVQAGTGPVHTITITAGMSIEDLADTINALDNLQAVIEIGTGANVGQQRVVISAIDGGNITLAANVGTALADLGYNDADTAGAGTPDQLAYETQYNDLLTQIDEFITDTGYRGINLLNGDDQTVTFNEDASSTLTVTGTTFDAAGLNISAADFSSVAAIDAAIVELTDALDDLRAQATTFGNNLSVIQTRQDFTTNLVNVLKDGATALTIADKNEEGANMLALQTAQQLGIQALSLASQANQSVLRLFA